MTKARGIYKPHIRWHSPDNMTVDRTRPPGNVGGDRAVGRGTTNPARYEERKRRQAPPHA
jgi:hypothetical protein